eukprot:scaffold129459_cov34-Cyclotella_meneghiniana.AAC.1
MENADGVLVGVNKVLSTQYVTFMVGGDLPRNTWLSRGWDSPIFWNAGDGVLRRHPPHSKKRVFLLNLQITSDWSSSFLSDNIPPPSSAAAAKIVEEFVQTLQFNKEQISALSQQANENLNIFEDFYSEAEKIQKVMDEGPSYSPPNCTVKLNHQAIDQVKADTAY